MKLGELRSVLRKMKGNPSVVVELVPGKHFNLVIQKTPFFEELDKVFPGGKAAETGLIFDADSGVVRFEGDATAAVPRTLSAPAEDDDILLDDEPADESFELEDDIVMSVLSEPAPVDDDELLV